MEGTSIKTKYSICAVVCLLSMGFMYLLVDTDLNNTPMQTAGRFLLPYRSKLRAQNQSWQIDPITLYNHPARRGRAKQDGAWVGTKDPIEIYAYSAFYDDRTSLMSLPVIRMIIVTEAADNNTLYCLLQYENRIRNHLIIAKRLGIGFGVNRHGKRFCEYVITCQLEVKDIPENVSIATTLSVRPDWSVPVELPEKPRTKNEFAVCVSVCYGKEWDVYKIVEWMELLKILGVTKVGIYNNTLGSEASRVFQYYDSQRFVDFRQSWNFLPDPGVLTSHLHWSPVINDCIYRNLYSFNKILVIDVDEAIVPKNVYNLSQLLRDIDQNQVHSTHPARSYTFRNDYFFYDIPHEDNTMPKYIKMLTHRWRLPPSNQGYSAKSIISPVACTHMHNHYCWGYTKQYNNKGHHIEVKPRFAVNQHYKKCHFSQSECQTMLTNITQDDIMLKYKDKLIKNVDLALKELKLKPIN